MIQDNYELVTKYCEGVQNALNEQTNIRESLVYQSQDIVNENLKKIFRRLPNSNYEIVEDKYFNYFIIRNKTYSGKKHNSYVEINGENMNNINIIGKIKGASKEEKARLTHFVNSDKKEKKDE